ncbi:MAG: hypothetical protein Q8L45_01890 [Xanthomonadaceae bacterium]|nr:hypothetical protein [Xanthomonadaceae bacterium]MDP2185432.1 hypothetical protein [Xanthomonadales bacterium]MDZ4116220.1 hypothetical protein [Xanthomonadaceae bacterium]MDZ4377000.1 hypothetical protein [Xanthomonadaceae bacterium]
MRQHTALLLLLAVAALAPMNASAAAHGQFSVGVQVVSSAPADRALLASVPAPANAAVMLAGRNARHHVFSGTIAQAAEFFRATLPTAGWHLVQLGGDSDTAQEQVWESSHGRVVVRLQAALGSTAATRISLNASARRQGV